MDWKKEEILVIAKAYPSPSTKYGESVCMAGITKDQKWIRIYPVPYRDLPTSQQFKKFQWINIKIHKSNEKLSRPESHKADSMSIKLLDTVGTGIVGWKDREKYYKPLISNSLEVLLDQQEKSGVSLGMFMPKYVEDFEIIPDSSTWEIKKQIAVGKISLFNQKKSLLEKIPYTFHYKFICNDNRCKGHNLTVVDWEAGESYRNFKRIYKSESLTLEKLKQKWLIYYFRERKSYFVVGTDSEFNKFMILTVVSPQRKELD